MLKMNLNLTAGPQLRSSLLCSPDMGHRQKPWVDHRLVGFCVSVIFSNVQIWGHSCTSLGATRAPPTPERQTFGSNWAASLSETRFTLRKITLRVSSHFVAQKTLSLLPFAQALPAWKEPTKPLSHPPPPQQHRGSGQDRGFLG